MFDDFDDGVATARMSDPLEGYNRVMFQVNDRLYLWVVEPVARGYATIIPEVHRVAVSNCFRNLGFPARFVHNAVQLKPKRAGVELSRFLINTTIGMGGLRDSAMEHFSLEPCAEDCGQTLGHYGVGEGVPLVLPVFGFSNVRDAVGRAPDMFLDPVTYVDPLEARLALSALELETTTSLRLGDYERLKRDALDPYTFFRDAYSQMRTSKIRE